MKLYYTPITTKTVCKNGSEKFGAHAITKFGQDPEKLFELELHGNSKKAAEQKLLNFLTGNGANEAIELPAPPPPAIPVEFTEWANDYFSKENNRLNTIIDKRELFQDFRDLTHLTISLQTFRTHLENWSQRNGYTYNPRFLTKNHGRIIFRLGERVREAIFISDKILTN